MTAPLWLKIACVAVFIVAMVAINQGAKAFFTAMHPQFVYGFLAGGAFVGLLLWSAVRDDRRSEAEQDL